VSRLEIEGMISKEFQRQWRIGEVLFALLPQLKSYLNFKDFSFEISKIFHLNIEIQIVSYN
jgi:hypothetical protein